MHFSADLIKEDTFTTTPRTASISCDKKGTVSVLVYSLFSNSCILESASSPIPIYYTNSINSARLINSQAIRDYDVQWLNSSTDSVADIVKQGMPTPEYPKSYSLLSMAKSLARYGYHSQVWTRERRRCRRRRQIGGSKQLLRARRRR
ncbi:hypothetical protein CYLTODRAFT_247422 [Cylindrobasidium torrendii FP15055 ss-10]|uniref:Uncharacterized protein n=1 Tax=Cylindrobasidium torrendii FP15055 ss-10 TaxID=1314674 RepID=A0A0D7BF73_9AGAR|nr:hypothetical protein CYLTODRAFT_247422 [Cylindrobasidium torrendii FP15055 ss-10]